MRRITVLVSLVSLMVALAPIPASAATGTVSGVVRLDGQPLVGVEVFLGIDFETPSFDGRFTCTAIDGSFQFTAVPLNTALVSATGPGVQLQGRCSNQEFLDSAAVPPLPLLTQYYGVPPGGPITFFQIDAAKSDLNFDVVRVPNTVPSLTAEVRSALNSCYTQLDAGTATTQAQGFLSQVDLKESGGEIDAATASLMRFYGENLLFVFGTDACRGSFTDDDNSIFELDIEWLVAQAVTKGCSADGTLYCPNDLVTRGQMAAFLSRALNLPAAGPSPFTDTVGSIFEADIAKVAQAGITKGCNAEGTLYCPNDSVTRGQMAAFLSRALNLPDGAVNTFVDDDGSIFEADIAKIAQAGITKGCTADGTKFCPNDLVTRGQMAAFLRRALE